jgi:hypothetical protein
MSNDLRHMSRQVRPRGLEHYQGTARASLNPVTSPPAALASPPPHAGRGEHNGW